MTLNNMSSERVRRGDNLKVKAPSHSNASADNEETGIMEASSSTTVNEDMAANSLVAESEQEQFDEVKDIERKAAEKEPYKRSYTAKADSEPAVKAIRQPPVGQKLYSELAQRQECGHSR